jgi:hypothetical protein
MTTSSNIRAIWILCVFILSSLLGFGQTVFQHQQSISGDILISADIPSIDLVETEVNGSSMYSVACDGCTPMLIKGAPDLPKLTQSYIIPDLAAMEVELVQSDYYELENIDLAPSKGNLYRDQDPRDVPYTFGETYHMETYFPLDPVDRRDPYILREVRAQTMIVYPVQYNPTTKTLRVYTHLEFKLKSKKNGEPVNPFYRKKALSEVDFSFHGIYQKMFPNYSSFLSMYAPVVDNGKLLIISKTTYLPDMEPYIEWKRQRGMTVYVADIATVGNTSTAIKSYVNTMYSNESISFVLLVGDAQHVTTYTATSGHSDNSYGYLNGNDSYPELFVGRFSAESSSEVQTMVERVIRYEKEPNSGGWFARGVGVASDQGPGDDNEYDYQHMRNIRTDLINYTYTDVYELYDGSQGGLDAPGNPTSTMLFNILENGISVFNYTGHGSSSSCATTGLNSSDVDDLTNVDMYPFIFSVACVNGNFVGGTCFAEKWIRATHDTTGAPTGAIATLMSTINQSWSPPMSGQDEMNDILVESYNNNKPRSFAAIAMNGCMQMNDDYGSSGDEMTDTWTCFGDPTVFVRTDVPTAMTVTHPLISTIGASSLAINGSVDSAFVSLMQNGQVLDAGMLINGSINLNFSALNTVDTLTLTVFAYNKTPYIAYLPVIVPNGPYVIQSAVSIQDALGNNDQEADYGETINFDLELTNVGTVSTTGLNVSISVNDPHVAVVNGTVSYSSLDSNNAASNNALSVTISDSVPDGYIVPVQISISDSLGNTWPGNFNLNINAPKLEFTDYSVDDSQNGNDNGVLDPGEAAVITFHLKNSGHSDAVISSNSALTSSSYLSLSGSPILTSIPEGATGDLSYNLQVGSGVNLGSLALIELSTDAGAYSSSENYLVSIGRLIEDFETGDFTSYNWGMGGNAPWTAVQTANGGTYGAQSGTITHDQSSEMGVSFQVIAPDSIRFYFKVSSEANYDYLRFMIDGVEVAAWSGEIPWTYAAFPVDPGQHSFSWIYEKDYIVTSGQDAAWVDDIQFPPALVPTPTTVDGNVSEWMNGGAIGQAEVTFMNATNTYTAQTDGQGNFVIPGFLTGIYDVYVSVWGFQPLCQQAVVLGAHSFDFELRTGYGDDFNTDLGWIVLSTATTGAWEMGAPLEVIYGATIVAPGSDVTSDCGESAYITGNGSNTPGADDVDGGYTLLRSPAMDLSGLNHPVVSYHVWWSASGGSTPVDDEMWVILTNGTDSLILDVFNASSTMNTWLEMDHYIGGQIPLTASMQLIVFIADQGGGHIVEGGFDHFRIAESGIGIEEESIEFHVYPNPVSDWLYIDSDEVHEGDRFSILDLGGRLLKSGHLDQASKRIFVGEFASGVYLLDVFHCGQRSQIKFIVH